MCISLPILSFFLVYFQIWLGNCIEPPSLDILLNCLLLWANQKQWTDTFVLCTNHQARASCVPNVIRSVEYETVCHFYPYPSDYCGNGLGQEVDHQLNYVPNVNLDVSFSQFVRMLSRALWWMGSFGKYSLPNYPCLLVQTGYSF